MKVSIILGHPYEESYNAAIAKTVIETLKENGHVVMFHDLYQEAFNILRKNSPILYQVVR